MAYPNTRRWFCPSQDLMPAAAPMETDYAMSASDMAVLPMMVAGPRDDDRGQMPRSTPGCGCGTASGPPAKGFFFHQEIPTHAAAPGPYQVTPWGPVPQGWGYGYPQGVPGFGIEGFVSTRQPAGIPRFPRGQAPNRRLMQKGGQLARELTQQFRGYRLIQSGREAGPRSLSARNLQRHWPMFQFVPLPDDDPMSHDPGGFNPLRIRVLYDQLGRVTRFLYG